MEQFIYGLCNPGSKDVLYVGRSKHAVERRRHHVQLGHSDFTPKGIWIKYLERVGKWPDMIILEKQAFVDEAEAELWAKEREHVWITNLFDNGLFIFNHGCWWKHPGRRQIPKAVRETWQRLHEIYFRLDFWLSRESDTYIEATRFQALRGIRALVEQYPAIRIAPLEWLDHSA